MCAQGVSVKDLGVSFVEGGFQQRERREIFKCLNRNGGTEALRCCSGALWCDFWQCSGFGFLPGQKGFVSFPTQLKVYSQYVIETIQTEFYVE